jgi:hypothetical protein
VTGLLYGSEVSGGVLSDWVIVRERCEWGSAVTVLLCGSDVSGGVLSDWVISVRYDLDCLF